MVLKDGRIGFIDFGIVGRIRPDTWEAVSDFISSVMVGNFDGMADAMIRIGITNRTVQADQLADDLRKLYQKWIRWCQIKCPIKRIKPKTM